MTRKPDYGRMYDTIKRRNDENYGRMYDTIRRQNDEIYSLRRQLAAARNELSSLPGGSAISAWEALRRKDEYYLARRSEILDTVQRVENERDTARRELLEVKERLVVQDAMIRLESRRRAKAEADLREAAKAMLLLLAYVRKMEHDGMSIEEWNALPAWMRQEIER